MELKDGLGEIEADGANLVHERLLEWALTPPLWHADAVGGVHTIKAATTRLEPETCRGVRRSGCLAMRAGVQARAPSRAAQQRPLPSGTHPEGFSFRTVFCITRGWTLPLIVIVQHDRQRMDLDPLFEQGLG